ncbi:MAG TPA: hypothetical protein VGZ22_03405, partial [Isosphaeraceae bacterium]|nr:hypothetical protein [Isosphaeraceae bacterium]
FNRPTPGMRAAFKVQFVLSVALPFLAAWTPALLLLRLRKPRPRLGRIARQPGAVACAVATTAMTIVALWILALWAAGVSGRVLHASVLFVNYSQLVGFAVVGGWASLALGGRWRQEPSWIDRAGKLAGAAWIVATALDWSRTFFLF